MTKRLVDISGRKFGRLLAMGFSGRDRKGRAYWLCRCDCGTEKRVLHMNLTGGRSKSCGCARLEAVTKHSLSQTPEYKSWDNMIRRCTDPSDAGYKNYGGRGISVCSRWMGSVEFFVEDMGEKPTPKHSLDRIDNEGNYEPSNCRWATQTEQARNTRANRTLELNGKMYWIGDLVEKYGVKRTTIIERLKRGMTVEEALLTPIQTRGHARTTKTH